MLKSFNCIALICILCFFGSSFANVDDVFLNDFDETDSQDAFDAQDPYDSYDAADPLDGYDPGDALDSLTQDTPDTDENLKVVDTNPAPAVRRKRRRTHFFGVYNELSLVAADVTLDHPYTGAMFTTGYSDEHFIYRLGTIYALSVLTGARMGVTYYARKYEDPLFIVSEPYLESTVRSFISVPLTVESKIDLFLWSILYDVGFQCDVFLWGYQRWDNPIHEHSKYIKSADPAFYFTLGVGNSLNIAGRRVEYLVKTTNSLFGYHIGKRHETRTGVSFNIWF